MHVWLTDWQVAEDHLLIRVGDTIDWTLYPADRSWVSRLLGDRLVIDWQFDTYGDAVDQPALRVSGEVAELRSVRCRQIQTDDGFVPVIGEATLQPVADTSGSWMRLARQEESAAVPGAETITCKFPYTSSGDSVEAEDLYGYVLSLAGSDGDCGSAEAR
ncbi:DUF6578 domain-containing protein [Arthrobacter sp. NPDC058097]|uniref:DUF6578 domain-containing protein n=1 Tax=Arthrobacter sp. NPDC058097 TaxID=3346340 RepID=UPI0036DE9899